MVAAENERDPTRVPTRANLLRAMRWLVEGSGSGDSLVFHFSGHGVQKLDLNGDEVDGYNEALCPADFERSGKILDDEINEIIVRPLGRGVKLHAVVDTCHSGTILDLPYLCRLSRYTSSSLHHIHSNTYDPLRPTNQPNNAQVEFLVFFRTGYWQWENQQTRFSSEQKCTSGGLAISISGCGDSQTSQDTTVSE